jgi:WD40 repeat protein
LELSSREGRVISASWDGTLASWNLKGRLVRRVSAGAPVTAMAASADLSEVWTGHEDGTLRRWNAELERQQQRRLPRSKRVTAMAMSGERLVVADQSGGLWLYPDLVTRNPEPLASLPTYLRSLVFRPGGGELYGGSWFYLYNWNLERGEMRRMRTPHHGIIAGLAWSPSRDELVSISRQTDSSVLALDPATGLLKDNFGKHDLCGASIAVTGDGRYLITTSDDASVRIWHLAPHEEAGLPQGGR